MKLNQILLVLAIALFGLSAFTYRESVVRAERFERGQKFLSNLNPDEIAVVEVTKGSETTRLRRDGERFVVVTAEGYRAKNDAVNRFIRDVLELGLEKEVGSGESLRKELELEPSGENTLEVAFKNATDKEMVRFLVGKAFDNGSGNYLLRTDTDDGEIYLSSSRVYLSTQADDFLDKDLLDVKNEEIRQIRGADFVIEAQEGSLELADQPAGKKASSKLASVKSVLTGLRFTKHHLADAPEVQGLRFDRVVEVDLDDDSGYRVAVAERDDKHYLQVTAYHNTDRVMIARDADEEEVKETADVLQRVDEVNDFNAYHGSWIYEVSEGAADKVRLTKADLIEDA